MAVESVPTVAEVRRIVAIESPVLRNLEITYCYSQLAAAFAARNGPGANWCTYATWASRQAGRTIRGEDLLAYLEQRLVEGRWVLHPIATLWRRLLRRGLFQAGTRLGRLTGELHTPFDAFERASDAVARGNLRVFEEIGLEFARVLAGEAPRAEGLLGRAFAHYQRLPSEDDPRKRAELAVPREPGDRPPRADAPAAADPRGVGRGFRNGGRPGPPGARGALPVRARAGGACCAARRPPRSAPWRARSSVLRAGSRARRSRTRSWCSPFRAACSRSAANLADPYPEELRRPRRPGAEGAPGPFRAGPAGAGRLRRARLVRPPPADALHRAPVPGLPPERTAVRAALRRGPGREPRPWRDPGRRPLTGSDRDDELPPGMPLAHVAERVRRLAQLVTFSTTGFTLPDSNSSRRKSMSGLFRLRDEEDGFLAAAQRRQPHPGDVTERPQQPLSSALRP